jgi:hypothetical protein
MPGWLAPVHTSLAGLTEPVTWFFRDDDAGWGDDHLWALAEVFCAAGVPLDVAAIPAEVGTGTARRLAQLVDEGAVRVYQHGWAHLNHELEGRRCEFGPGRTAAEQYADLTAGRGLLAELLDGRAEPVFVPPWNRCTSVTLDLLAALGFAGLSRDADSARCDHQALGEAGVRVDWARLWRQGGPWRVGHALAAAVADVRQAGRGTVGVMLHHAVMGPAELSAAWELLAVVHDHPAVRVSPLATLVRQARDASLRGPACEIPAPARRTP